MQQHKWEYSYSYYRSTDSEQIQGIVSYHVGYRGETLNLIWWTLPQAHQLPHEDSRPSDSTPSTQHTEQTRNSIERVLPHPQQTYDHLRPTKLSDEANPFKVSILASVEENWWYIDSTMLIKNPMYLRRTEFTSIRQREGENAGTYLRRIMSAGTAAQMEQFPTQTLLIIVLSDHQEFQNQSIHNTIHLWAIEEGLQFNWSTSTSGDNRLDNCGLYMLSLHYLRCL